MTSKIFLSGLFFLNSCFWLYGQPLPFTEKDLQEINAALEKAAKDYYVSMLKFNYTEPLDARRKIRNAKNIQPLFLATKLDDLELFNDLDAPEIKDFYAADEYLRVLNNSESINLAYHIQVKADALHSYNDAIQFDKIEELKNNIAKNSAKNPNDYYYINTIYVRNFKRVPIQTTRIIDRPKEQIVVCWQYNPRRNKNGKLQVNKKDFLIVGTLSFSAYLNYLNKDLNKKYNQHISSSFRLIDLPPKPRKNEGVKNVKDSDKDGIIDSNDKCPKDPGLIDFDGCPDADKDGVPEPDDQCPNEPGSRNTNGCPDSDRDGVADKDDFCPEEKGSLMLGGCPDQDNDGTRDRDDNCPDEPGPKSNYGCPYDESGFSEYQKVKQKLNNEALKTAKEFLSTVKGYLERDLNDIDNILPLFINHGEGAIIRVTNHKRKTYDRFENASDYLHHLTELKETYDSIKFDFTLLIEDDIKPGSLDDGQWIGTLHFLQNFYGFGKPSYCDSTEKYMKLIIQEQEGNFEIFIKEIWFTKTEEIQPCGN